MFCKLSRSHLFSKALVLTFIALTAIALPVSAQDQTEPTSYDPAIHIWREGMTPQGNMHSNVVTGTIVLDYGNESIEIRIPIFDDTTGVQFQVVETGSVTLPQEWRNTRRSPNRVRGSSWVRITTSTTIQCPAANCFPMLYGSTHTIQSIGTG
jgi:hypothetical protein